MRIFCVISFSPEPPLLCVRGLVPPELVCREEPPDASVTRFLEPKKRKFMPKSAKKALVNYVNIFMAFLHASGKV